MNKLSIIETITINPNTRKVVNSSIDYSKTTTYQHHFYSLATTLEISIPLGIVAAIIIVLIAIWTLKPTKKERNK